MMLLKLCYANSLCLCKSHSFYDKTAKHRNEQFGSLRVLIQTAAKSSFFYKSLQHQDPFQLIFFFSQILKYVLGLLHYL